MNVKLLHINTVNVQWSCLVFLHGNKGETENGIYIDELRQLSCNGLLLGQVDDKMNNQH